MSHLGIMTSAFALPAQQIPECGGKTCGKLPRTSHCRGTRRDLQAAPGYVPGHTGRPACRREPPRANLAYQYGRGCTGLQDMTPTPGILDKTNY
jgi:hypothetical protein